MLRMSRQDWPNSSLPDTHSKHYWIGRLIEVNWWADETNRLLSLFLCALGFWKEEKVWGIILIRCAEDSLLVSQVSVMPGRSMLLWVMRSDRAVALFRMEQAFTVPRWRLRPPRPGFRLTSSTGATYRSRDIPRYYERLIVALVVTQGDPNRTVNAETGISECQWQQQKGKPKPKQTPPPPQKSPKTEKNAQQQNAHGIFKKSVLYVNTTADRGQNVWSTYVDADCPGDRVLTEALCA